MGVKTKLIQVMSLNVVLWMLMLLAYSGLLLCAGGIYLLLADRFSPVQAMLMTGGGLLGITVLLILVAMLASSSKKKSEAKQMRANPDNALEHQIRPMLGDQATDWAKRHTGLTVVGALSAGVILAASPRLRATLLGAVGPLFTRKAIQAVQQFSDNA